MHVTLYIKGEIFFSRVLSIRLTLFPWKSMVKLLLDVSGSGVKPVLRTLENPTLGAYNIVKGMSYSKGNTFRLQSLKLNISAPVNVIIRAGQKNSDETLSRICLCVIIKTFWRHSVLTKFQQSPACQVNLEVSNRNLPGFLPAPLHGSTAACLVGSWEVWASRLMASQPAWMAGREWRSWKPWERWLPGLLLINNLDSQGFQGLWLQSSSPGQLLRSQGSILFCGESQNWWVSPPQIGMKPNFKVLKSPRK